MVRRTFLTFILPLLFLSTAAAQDTPADLANSRVSVRVFKSGLFSAFAHDHLISAPLADASLNLDKRTVSVTFRTADMKVLDPGVTDKDRAEIERTMKSDKVLDIVKFPEISFVSRSAGAKGQTQFTVTGDLTIHGVTRSAELPVSFVDGRYRGAIKLKQTDYGIAPVSIGGGTVKVKDVIEIAFEIVPAK